MAEPTKIVGTPIEVEELVRAFFEGVRNGMAGYTMELKEDGFHKTPKSRECARKVERTLWEVTITPLDEMAPDRCRKSLKEKCARLELVHELFNAMSAERD